jgi:hypothetical protein
MSRPGFKPWLPALEGGTLAKSYSKSLLQTIQNIYMTPPQQHSLCTKQSNDGSAYTNHSLKREEKDDMSYTHLLFSLLYF